MNDGTAVGEPLLRTLGELVGVSLGMEECVADGAVVGEPLCITLGELVGASLGMEECATDGGVLGEPLRIMLGGPDGISLTKREGVTDGSLLGESLGMISGEVGTSEGSLDGLLDCTPVGFGVGSGSVPTRNSHENPLKPAGQSQPWRGSDLHCPSLVQKNTSSSVSTQIEVEGY